MNGQTGSKRRMVNYWNSPKPICLKVVAAKLMRRAAFTRRLNGWQTTNPTKNTKDGNHHQQILLACEKTARNSFLS